MDSDSELSDKSCAKVTDSSIDSTDGDVEENLETERTVERNRFRYSANKRDRRVDKVEKRRSERSKKTKLGCKSFEYTGTTRDKKRERKPKEQSFEVEETSDLPEVEIQRQSQVTDINENPEEESFTVFEAFSHTKQG